MPLTDPFKKVVKSQKELLADLEKEIRNLDENDLISENEQLKSALEKTETNLHHEKEQNKNLTNENSQLKNALYEQIYNEKMALLRAADKRINLYFQSKTQAGLNQLTEFEKKAKQQIDAMSENLRKNRIDTEDEIFHQLEELKTTINVKVTKAQQEWLSSSGTFSKNRESELAALEKDHVTEYEIKGVLRKNNLESLIGLNILSKIGILFLIIAVITLASYGYVKLSNEMKGILIFILGALLLGIGEWLNRKITTIFSIALTSGGIAILYAAVSLSYLVLSIISIEIALLLIVLITALAFILSIRYNAETIIVFAMIGGYLPVVTLTSPDMPSYVIMSYFIILNLLLLLVATKKHWTVAIFIGFALNLAATLFIMQKNIYKRPAGPLNVEDLITLLYIFLVFLIYTLIPMVAVISRKARFKISDIVLIALNTVISSILLNASFFYLDLENYLGILAVVFATIYLILGWWLERKMPSEKLMNKLFYLTGFTFVILFIPYQFKTQWLTLGWLIEGVVLVTYGVLKEEKAVKWGGIVISLLCLLNFLFIDLLGPKLLYFESQFFFWKYFSITLGSIIILSTFAFKKTMQGWFVKTFKYITTVNCWIFCLYLIQNELYDEILFFIEQYKWYNAPYIFGVIGIIITFLIAYCIARIRPLADLGMKIISIALYIIGVFWLFGLNIYSRPVPFGSAKLPLGVYIIGTVILVLISVLSILAVREIAMAFVVDRDVGIEWFPVLISAYIVIILTQNLITQYGFEFQSLIISIIYIVTALLWIMYGFIKRYKFIRIFGLVLSIVSTAKLVFIDLRGLNTIERVISYFSFGIFLLAISLVYQHFNKRMEINTEVIPDEKKDSY